MKDGLNIGKFTELTEAEAEMAEGGSVLTKTFEMIYSGLCTLAKPFPLIGTALANTAAVFFALIETWAADKPLFNNPANNK